MSDDRERSDTGQFVESVTDYDMWSYILHAERPFQPTGDVADHFEIDRSQAYRRLQAMADRGDLRKEKVGSRAVVWWVELGICDRCEEEPASEISVTAGPMEPTSWGEPAPVGDLSSVSNLCKRCWDEWVESQGDYASKNDFLESDPEW